MTKTPNAATALMQSFSQPKAYLPTLKSANGRQAAAFVVRLIEGNHEPTDDEWVALNLAIEGWKVSPEDNVMFGMVCLFAVAKRFEAVQDAQRIAASSKEIN